MTYHQTHERSALQAERDLIAMLKTRRPGRSKSEKRFIREWLMTLPNAVQDSFGNVRVKVGESKVVWSSHTDTVHKTGGEQRVVMADSKQGRLLRLSSQEKGSNCLGADCTTGVWIMREMILGKVPGLYIFHRDEESGGAGSGFIAKREPSLLAEYKYCIAFDRKGTDSIISHQMSERCCSQAFIDSMARLLPGKWKADDGGTFTDSANYVDHIGECSNISVGYLAQHTTAETQLIDHALILRESMLRFDESKLVASRAPGEVDEWDDLKYGWQDHIRGKGVWEKDGKYYDPRTYDLTDSYRKLAKFCANHPDEVADYLEQLGVTVDELYDYAPHIARDRADYHG